MSMRIYVGNLPRQLTEVQLGDVARRFGTPVFADIARDHAGGASKGFGFVEYTSDEEGRAAISGLDGMELDGRILQAREANVPEPCAAGSILHSRD